jgi:hypothetical protein
MAADAEVTWAVLSGGPDTVLGALINTQPREELKRMIGKAGSVCSIRLSAHGAHILNIFVKEPSCLPTKISGRS